MIHLTYSLIRRLNSVFKLRICSSWVSISPVTFPLVIGPEKGDHFILLMSGNESPESAIPESGRKRYEICMDRLTKVRLLLRTSLESAGA